MLLENAIGFVSLIIGATWIRERERIAAYQARRYDRRLYRRILGEDTSFPIKGGSDTPAYQIIVGILALLIGVTFVATGIAKVFA
jgi:hypothetical protein